MSRNFVPKLKLNLNPIISPPQLTFSNFDLFFWDWLWSFLDKVTGQDLRKGKDTKWAIGGSFAIFWWECLFGIAEKPVSWSDIDISLNYGEFVFIGKNSISDINKKLLYKYPNIDFLLTQKIASQIVELCGGKRITPVYYEPRKQLSTPVELYVNLKNNHPFKLDLSFKDDRFFKASNNAYGSGGIYYFELEGSFETPLLVPVFSIQTLLEIYKDNPRYDPEAIKRDESKIRRLIKLDTLLKKKGEVPRVFNPCNVQLQTQCFMCDQRTAKRSPGGAGSLSSESDDEKMVLDNLPTDKI